MNNINKVVEMKYDLDLSEAYIDRLEDLETKCLDDEQMNTFLFDCFCEDDIVLDVWESIQENYICEYNCIDFDNQWFNEIYWSGEYPIINIYLSESITLEVTINIFFNIDWNANKDDYDAYCLHDYNASVLHIENIKKVEQENIIA